MPLNSLPAIVLVLASRLFRGIPNLCPWSLDIPFLPVVKVLDREHEA